jgi:hypothetical protein
VADLLQQLENNEAILLMYLAEELPAEDRAEVDQMLAADAGLRNTLERLREAQDGLAAALPALDRIGRLPVPESVAVRRVVRSMEQWQARRLANPPAAVVGPTLRYPWWAYPMAAAASVVIAFLVWWGNTDQRASRFVDTTPNYQEIDDRPSDADFLAAFLSLTGTPEEPDYGPSLAEPTDFAVLMLIDEPGTTTDTPSEGEDLEPAEFGFEINELYL